MCFFFQAEDGIRDLVRSRGLGDVYKRQGGPWAVHLGARHRSSGKSNGEPSFHETDPGIGNTKLDPQRAPGSCPIRRGAVSYTHLTLPTSDLV